MLKFLSICFSLLLFTFHSSGQKKVGFLGGHDDDVEVVALSPNGELIATGSYDNTIHVYVTDSALSYIGSFEGHNGPVTSLSFSRDGKYLLSGSQDKRVIRWQIVEDSMYAGWYTDLIKIEEFSYHSQQIVKVVYGPGMRVVYSASTDGQIVGYDKTKKKKRMIDVKETINAMQVSADRRYYFVATNTPVIKQLDVLGKETRTFEGHTDVVNDIAVSLNRKYMVSASSDKTAIVWNLATGKIHKTLQGHTWKVTSVNISLDSKYVVSCSNDGGTIVWDLESGEKISEMNSDNGYNARSVVITGDLQRVITALHFDEHNEEGYGAVAYSSGIDPKIANSKVPSNLSPAMRRRLGLDKKANSTQQMSPEVRKRLGLDKKPSAKPVSKPATPKPEVKKEVLETTDEGVEISVEETID